MAQESAYKRINPFGGPSRDQESASAVVQPEMDAVDSIMASMELAAQDTALGSVMRAMTLPDRDDGPMLTAQEANKRASEMPYSFDMPFNEDLSEKRFNEIVERQRRRQFLGRQIQLGPKALQGTVAQFAIGMVPHMLDPIEIGAFMATGGVFGALGVGVGAMRAGRLAQASARRLTMGKVAAREIAAGIIGNTVTEPLVKFANNQERVDYDLADSLYTVALATTGIAGASIGLKYFSNKIQDRVHRMDTETRAAVDNALKGRFIDGKKIDMGVIETHIRNHLDYDLPQGKVFGNGKTPQVTADGYTFREINLKDPVDVEGTSFFVISKSGKTNFDEARALAISDNMGEAFYMTDSLKKAHNELTLATNRGGRIWEVRLPKDAKILSLNEPVPKEIQSSLEKILKDVFSDADANTLSKSLRVQSVFDQVRNKIDDSENGQAILNKINGMLYEKGYKGIHHTGGGSLDARGSQHNVVALFDMNNVQPRQHFAPDHNLRYKPDRAEVAKQIDEYFNRQSDVAFDEKADATLTEFAQKTPDLDKVTTEYIQREAEAGQFLKSIDEKAFESVKKENDKLKRQEAEIKEIDKAIRTCLLKGELVDVEG